VSDGRTPILYIAPWIDLGGSDRGTIDWFKHIDRERWAPSLITTTPSPNRWLQQVEPYADEIWNLPDLMPGGAFPEFILGFIESRKVPLVHIMNARLAYDLLPDMTCLPNPPAVVVQLHAEEPNQTGYVRYVARRYGNLIDAFSVVSEDLKKTIVDYEIPPSRIEVIYLGVDGEGEFDPDRVEPLALEGGDVPRILWPGRLVEQKDPMLTLDVVARARERGAEFVLDIVGDGHMKESVQARARELGVADIVHWHTPSKEMARWYRSSDVVLMTSLYEGVPLVIYEALAMGVPVVAPALSGNVELMEGDGGLLIDPRDDVDAYAEALVTLLGDERLRKQVGLRSRERMLADFSLEQMGRGHDALYERLLSQKTASSRWRNEELLGDPDPGHDGAGSGLLKPLRLSREPLPEQTVGVIVPCFRHGIFLDACIASIKAQTHAPAAIVVVDDCSDDPETLEALARLDRDPDVTVLRQPENRGPSAARNRALTEIETSYFLPVDADDELLPDALERMLASLERASEEVGFVYPHAQHIGNRTDCVRSPDYNVWLLMKQNYCPAPALFDRRLFDGTGIAYPEEIVVGHEDWDLVLQLAERGVQGIPADAPTFLYRKQGFSRVNAVDYGPVDFQETVEKRHPRLYGNSEEIKASWAPALSIVLLDEDGATWAGGDLLPLERQTCGDFEVLARGDLSAGVRPVEVGDDAPLAWLQAAVYQARGRWILLLPRSAAAALASRSFVEQLIHAFIANERTVATVLAEAPDISRVAFSQLDNAERIRARPAAVAFERPLWGRAPEVPLGTEGTLLADLVVGLRALGPVQWRLVSAEQGVAPWSASPTTRGTRVDLNLDRSAPAAEIAMRHMVSHQAPRLPELTPGTIRRWRHLDSWVPAQTSLLCRHRDPKTGVRMVNLDREPHPGYVLDQVLGCTRIFPAPGSARLIHADHSFSLGREGALAEGEYDLGYVESQPLPMLVGLELRRVPGPEGTGGQEILVAGPDDPLAYQSEHLATLGWIEPHPILPRPSEILHTGPWAVDSLLRRVDEDGWKHDYHAEAPDGTGDGITLGFLRRHPGGADLVALRRRSDGRLASELCIPGRASRDPQKLGRWLAEPVVFGDSAAARRAGAGSRLRHLALGAGNRRLADDEGEVMGYLQRQNGPGSSTLYSTIHPVTGDQIVTRFPEQAGEQGYVLDGILGSIFDPDEDGEIERITPLPWGRLPRPG
jgi:glycosyltransferase involved in cell wall biosynthesis